MNTIQQIIERRKQNGITQRALAIESGVSFSLITKLETGVRSNPTLDTINKLEAAIDRLTKKPKRSRKQPDPITAKPKAA